LDDIICVEIIEYFTSARICDIHRFLTTKMPTMSLELVENGMSIVLPPNRHSNNNHNLSSSSTDTDNESMDVVVAPLTTTNSSTQTMKQQKRKRNNRRHTVQTSTSNNKRRDTIQLFAFDSDVTANTGDNVSTGRPRRTVSYCVLVFCLYLFILYSIPI